MSALPSDPKANGGALNRPAALVNALSLVARDLAQLYPLGDLRARCLGE